LPPKFDIEQRLAGDVQRSILAPAAIGFGIVFGAPKAFASREADPPFAEHVKVERVVLNALANKRGSAA